jgi:diguanylate cyclase (GGDEF)-like protein
MPVAILLMDIDHFKRVNDTYGHPVGDLVLKEVSRGIRASLRDIDVICRYGGEEFVAILPGCSIKEAAVAGERVRTTVEAMQRNGVTLPAPVTISIGVASFPHPFSTPSGLIKGADEALYGAKQKGRNRVVTAR